MVTKNEIQRITNTLEDIATRVKRIDDDRVLTYQWVKRIEDKVEQHDNTINKIKSHLQYCIE